MLDLETFKKYIGTLRTIRDRDRSLYALGINLSEYNDPYWSALKILESQIDPAEWIGWFCYENDFGEGELTAHDKDGKPICRNVEELWDALRGPICNLCGQPLNGEIGNHQACEDEEAALADGAAMVVPF